MSKLSVFNNKVLFFTFVTNLHILLQLQKVFTKTYFTQVICIIYKHEDNLRMVKTGLNLLLFFLPDNLNKPDASATVYEQNNLKVSIKLTEYNKNNQFYLKLVDKEGNEQIKQFTVDGDDTFDYYWYNLRKGENYRIFVKEFDGRIEGPWYFVDEVSTGM